jgi:hypothetical protein
MEHARLSKFPVNAVREVKAIIDPLESTPSIYQPVQIRCLLKSKRYRHYQNIKAIGHVPYQSTLRD